MFFERVSHRPLFLNVAFLIFPVLLATSFGLHAKVFLDEKTLVYQGEISKENNENAFELFKQAEVKPTTLAITHFAVHYPSSLVMNSLIIDSAFIVFALCVWRYLYSRLKKGWNV